MSMGTAHASHGPVSREFPLGLILVLLLRACLNDSGRNPFDGLGSATALDRPVMTIIRASCYAHNLRMFAQWQGADQSEVGWLVIVGNTRCILRGHPRISLITSSVRALPVTVRYIRAGTIPPLGRIPGRLVAYVSLSWGNWCSGQVRLPITLTLTLPNHGGRLQTAVRYGSFSRRVWAHPPPCVAPGKRSTLLVGPFQAPPHRSR